LYFEAPMDPLSAVCSSLSVKELIQGKLYLPNPSWGILFPAGRPGFRFGVSLKGSCWLSVANVDTPVQIQEGDCYLIGIGQPYRIATAPEAEALDLHDLLTRGAAIQTAPSDIATPEKSQRGSTMTGAGFVFDEDNMSPVLDQLPPMIHFRADSPTAHALRSLLSILAYEAVGSKPGAVLAVDHLARIFFVHMLRGFMAYEKHFNNRLGAFADTKISAVLSLMHCDSNRPWTVAELAAAVGMSRSSFALRFKTVVGSAPLDYWLQWRMRRASQWLANGDRTVSSIAFALGYESERNFARAFKRVMGHTPTWYRKVNRPLFEAAIHRLAATDLTGNVDARSCPSCHEPMRAQNSREERLL
jgi:AraC-like DNA-binding protein